jgi:hypothetical protein
MQKRDFSYCLIYLINFYILHNCVVEIHAYRDAQSWWGGSLACTAHSLVKHVTLFIMPHYEDEPKIDTSAATGDWRESLFRDGYVVVKGVLSSEKAQHYRERMFQWLETFPYGFKANDTETWGKEYLPEHMK